MNIVLVSSGPVMIDDGHVFVTVGQNCWGKGRTALESVKNAHKNRSYNKQNPRVYITKVAPIDCRIDDVDGSLWWSEHPKDCKVCTAGKGIIIRLTNDQGKTIWP